MSTARRLEARAFAKLLTTDNSKLGCDCGVVVTKRF